MALKTDYLDDILNADINTRRKYNIIQNNDGTVSFEDVTEYSQVGTVFGAEQVNEITREVNRSKNELDEKISKSDIVDNLLSTAANLPLSAKQGKILKDFHDVQTEIMNKNWIEAKVYKSGHTKIFRISNYPKAKMTAETKYFIGTLSSDFNPSYSVYQRLSAGTENLEVVLEIDNNGNANITPLSDVPTSKNININVTYF